MIVRLAFTNEAFHHTFTIDLTNGAAIDRTIRTWKPLGYTLSSYYYVSL